ncbi:MAG: Gfo/Idh/MocA family oxidoreductase [Bryobacteraceae bacterium]|nr:Gfo/Idh/MocA family oxidoreductase [Bryobacteraceae bacterium]
MHRRKFLQAAAAGAGAALASDRKIRTGILGIQHSHLAGKIMAMRGHPAYELASVCEPDEATRKARQGEEFLGGLKWVTLDQMLEDSSLELIVFEGEVKDAIPFARRVIEAGKHLHLEKPPGDRLEPFRELADLARERRRLLQLGYLWRFHEGVERAHEAMTNGWLGRVFLVRAAINSDRDAAQRAVEARYPGGSMFELGGHMIDLVVRFLGRPAKVQPWLRHDGAAADNLKDNTLAVFEYDRALGIVTSAAMMGGSSPHRGFELLGEDGSIAVQPMEPAPVMRVYLRAPRGPYRAGWQTLHLPPQPRYVADFIELAAAIRESRPLRFDWDHELLLHETLLRASGELS